jgi:flavin-dependent dehydrogenase
VSHEQIPSTADVIIAGGGPAGATLARLLAELGYRTVLFEKHRFPRPHIGESLTPQIIPVFDFLGVRARVEARGFLRMVGHSVCWGDSRPRASYYSTDHSRRGFQVWREDFDSLLLTHAREGGGHVFEEQLVKGIEFGANRVTVTTRHSQTTAAFFIDATGRGGILARQNLRQRDPIFQTLAVTGYWRDASGPPGIDFANTLLETYENGLVWSVPLHNGLRNVTLLVDWDMGEHIRQAGLRSFYQTELAKVSYITQFLSQARLVFPPRAFDATWHTAASFAGDRFLLAGDAGVFVDPLSSEGVHKAMASSITGAAVINTILQRPGMASHARDFYEGVQHSLYEAYYRQSAEYYREEQRWPDAPFWRRRSQQYVPVSSPQSPVPSSQSPIIVSHLSVAPEVTIEQRPVIEGPFVELRDVLIAPSHPRGVRFLDNVCAPTLLRAVQAHGAVARVMETYLRTPEGRQCPPESVRQVLARLYHEGVLTASAPDETQSS